MFANKVLETLGMNEWAGKLADQRLETQHEVREQLKSVFKQQPLNYWVAKFEPLDACVEPVLTTEEAFSHPHFIERGMISHALTEEGESIPQLNSALPFRSNNEHQAGRPLGADTDAVMSKIGFDQSGITRLRASGVIK